MTVYNNYSTRNMPSVHYGRMNVWNGHFAHANAARENFFRTVPPYSSKSLFCGYPMCMPPMYPMGGYCGIGNLYGGFILGNVIGSTIRSIVGLVKSIF